MDDRRRAHRGDLARRAPRQGARPDAVDLGDRRDDRGRAWWRSCCRSFGWRAVFFVGVLPALVVLWIRRDVPESRDLAAPAGSSESAGLAAPAVAQGPAPQRPAGHGHERAARCSATGASSPGSPPTSRCPSREGGRGLDLMKTTTWLVVMGVGKWLGYALFGFFADAVGPAPQLRRLPAGRGRARPALRHGRRRPFWLLLLGPFVAFFGTGFFSGFSAIASELFPTEIRATAMGLSYNIGRGLSAAAPAIVGLLADALRPRLGLLPAGRRVLRRRAARAGPARDEGQAPRLIATRSSAPSPSRRRPSGCATCRGSGP